MARLIFVGNEDGVGPVELTYHDDRMTVDEARLFEREVIEGCHTGQMLIEAGRRKASDTIRCGSPDSGTATDETTSQGLGGEGSRAWFDGDRVVHRRLGTLGVLETLSPIGELWAVYDAKKLNAGQTSAAIWAGDESELTANWRLDRRADGVPAYAQTGQELAAEEAERLRLILDERSKESATLFGQFKELQNELEAERARVAALTKEVAILREAETELSDIRREVGRLIHRHQKT